MVIRVPQVCMVLLLGASGAGKSTFARRHFLPFEILSSDKARSWIADDENDQSVTADAFELLQWLARKRLSHRKSCVIDATNVRSRNRACYAQFAAEAGRPGIAIYLDVEQHECLRRTRTRLDRTIPESVVLEQLTELRNSIPSLLSDGFQVVYWLHGAAEIDNARVERQLVR